MESEASMISSSSFFPSPSEELSHNLIHSILQNMDTSSMSDQERSAYIDYLYNDSSISPMNIDQTLVVFPQLPSLLPNYPQYPPSSAMSYNPIPVESISSVVDETFNYEANLALQEQMGSVNVGLSEDTISKNLKTSHIHVVKEGECEVCAVCQDEYRAKEMIGILQCGHRYHANCIKDWLCHKNVCPICKATALAI